MTDEIKEKTMDFVLLSLVNYVNTLEMTTEEREKLLNIVFNVMTNSLQPDAAYYFNEAIFDKVEKAIQMDEDKSVDILKKMGLR